MAVGKEQLSDPLPADIKSRVVWRENFWLTDEALSTYRSHEYRHGSASATCDRSSVSRVTPRTTP
jgi:hypothetical protein